MGKKFVEQIEGKIKRIYVPDIYEDGCILPEDYVDIICLEVEVDDKLIKLSEPRYGKASFLFVGDIVKINKYSCEIDYDEYMKDPKEFIGNKYKKSDSNMKEYLLKKYQQFFVDNISNLNKIIQYKLD